MSKNWVIGEVGEGVTLGLSELDESCRNEGGGYENEGPVIGT